jgi:DNA polymerase III subunit gamma/tau
MSFYRTYRPQVIGEIDNEHVRRELMSLLVKDTSQLPHAFLMSGPRGAGKTTAARLIAKIFNCAKSKGEGPCGSCEQCRSIASGTHIDVLEIDAASNRGIDEIRLLKERIGLTPSHGSYTVYIVDEVHMLTTEAFNALLKTLEEPPAHAVFVLATTELSKVPATIQSRCMPIRFHKAGMDELLSAMERIVKNESLKIDKEALALIAGLSDGSFRDAVKMLEQAGLDGEAVTGDTIRSKFALSETGAAGDLLTHLHEGREADAIKMIETLVNAGTDMKAFMTAVMSRLSDSLVAVVTGGRKQSEEGLTVDDIKLLIRLLTRAFSELKASPLRQLPLELAVIEFCRRNAHPDQSSAPAADSAVPKQAAGIREAAQATVAPSSRPTVDSKGLISLAKLMECWPDIIVELKSYNHSIAGVLRSTRPRSVTDTNVTIEAFYKFHQEKLSEPKVRDALTAVFKKLFGETVSIEIVLGKK